LTNLENLFLFIFYIKIETSQKRDVTEKREATVKETWERKATKIERERKRKEKKKRGPFEKYRDS
jgi:hypothetical protein